MTIMSSREFNQDTSGAKKAADSGAVFITDRGKPAYVLLRIDAYERLIEPRGSIVDKLSMPEAAEIEFDPPKLDYHSKPVDFD